MTSMISILLFAKPILPKRRIKQQPGMPSKFSGKPRSKDRAKAIKRGQLLWHEERGGPFKVMTVVDGYVVMRRPGCMPFLETVRDVGRKWLTADPVTPNA